MTEEEWNEYFDDLEKRAEEYARGELKDDSMSPECRADWIDKCNS